MVWEDSAVSLSENDNSNNKLLLNQSDTGIENKLTLREPFSNQFSFNYIVCEDSVVLFELSHERSQYLRNHMSIYPSEYARCTRENVQRTVDDLSSILTFMKLYENNGWPQPRIEMPTRIGWEYHAKLSGTNENP